MVKLHLDFETHSVVDLKRVGVYRYAEHSSTAIWLFAYRFDNGVVSEWRPGRSAPAILLDHVAQAGKVVAHNANFERQIWNAVLRRTPGCESWPRLEITQMDCTQSRALALHLPPDLETLGQVLDLKQQKDVEGHRLMMKMAKPRPKKRRKGVRPVAESYVHTHEIGPGEQCDDSGAVEWWDSPENIDRLGAYCRQDVLAECEVDAKLPPLSANERAIWELDQKINDRGIALDIAGIEKIVAVLDVAQKHVNVRMSEFTNGFVNKVTKAGKFVLWLQDNGIPIDSIAKSKKDMVCDWVDVLGNKDMNDALKLRFEVGKNSIAKYRRMLEVVCDDGRARGLLRYHMAGTGRWGGVLIQPHNLPRVDEDTELPDVLGMLEALRECS
jgi:DNA polymerase bacteriophage-type